MTCRIGMFEAVDGVFDILLSELCPICPALFQGLLSQRNITVLIFIYYKLFTQNNMGMI